MSLKSISAASLKAESVDIVRDIGGRVCRIDPSDGIRGGDDDGDMEDCGPLLLRFASSDCAAANTARGDSRPCVCEPRGESAMFAAARAAETLPSPAEPRGDTRRLPAAAPEGGEPGNAEVTWPRGEIMSPCREAIVLDTDVARDKLALA